MRYRLGAFDYSGLEYFGEMILAQAGLRMERGSRGFRELMYRIVSATAEAVEKMLQRSNGVPVRTPPPPPEYDQKAVRPYVLDDLVRDYMADPGASRTNKTRMGYEIIFGMLKELLGAEKPVAEIEREDCRRVQALLQRLPANARKLYPTLTLEQAAERAAADGRKLLSPATVNSYLNNLASLFKWAEEEGKIIKTPAAGLRVVDPVRNVNRRWTFTSKDLQAIFSAPLYTGCLNDEGGYSQPGPAQPRRGRFWVPLLALLHGVRQTEACQLLVDDVREIGGV